MKQFFSILLFIIFFVQMNGQNKKQLLVKEKYILVEKSVIQIDTFSIQPDFFEIFYQNHRISKEKYKVDFVEAKLYLKNFDSIKGKIIQIYYVIYPQRYHKTYIKFVRPKSPQDTLLMPVFSTQNNITSKPFDGLKTQGNIRRGATTGNHQSLVMQSGLDLKIEGNLSKKVKLKAVLSDDNLPQAYAGISQSYKDFNRIYMQLSAPKWQATGGDLILKNTQSRFLKFQRKIQGLDFEIGHDKKIGLSGGIIDGTYNRMQFPAQEGNLGPYLLKGKNNETYIFIIAGTEKIYINGKLLTREQDYNIRYETGELIFRPSINISANDRITAEFNYSNQNYLRYLNRNFYRQNSENSEFEFYTYLEHDNKNQPLLYNLTPQQVQALKNAGDDPEQLYILSAKPSNYNENKILYKKVALGNNFYFEYAAQDEPDLYEVRFSYIGKNQGSYAIDKIIALGKIYKFVGQGNGDYEPKTKLTAPLSNKYAGFRYKKVLKNDRFASEILFNNTDLNTFSSIDDTDNTGGAAHFFYEKSLKSDTITQWNIYGSYDFIHQNFVALDPYYDPEFSRRWQLDSIFGKQHFLDFGTSLSNKKNNWQAGIKWLQMRDTIHTQQGYFQGNGILKNIKWEAQNRWTNRQNPNGKSQFFDLENTFIIPIKKWNWFNTLHYEKLSSTHQNIIDSLNYAYKFFETGFIKKDSAQIFFETGFRWAANDSIQNNQLSLARKSVSGFIKFRKKHKGGYVHLNIMLKNLKYLFANRFRRFVNLQVSVNQYFFRKILQGTANLESYNGNILQDEIIYVETQPGQGNYQWNDYNGNGIKEINEFEPAVFSDQSRYIRVVLPSKNLIPVLHNKYVFQWIINPSVGSDKSFFKHFYNRFFWQYGFQKKQENTIDFLVWKPADALLNNYRYGNEFFVNRGAKKYNIRLLWQKLGNEQLLVIGKQSLQIEKYSVETRHFFTNYWLWKQKFAWITSKRFAEDYQAKNYELQERKIEQNLSFLQAQKADLQLTYQYKFKKNLSGSEVLKSNLLGIDYTKFPKEKYSFHTGLKFVLNNFSGNDTTPVAFQMLEALQKGKNMLFELSYRQKLTSYLEMNLNYNFRISENNPAIHTGGIMLKMMF